MSCFSPVDKSCYSVTNFSYPEIVLSSPPPMPEKEKAPKRSQPIAMIKVPRTKKTWSYEQKQFAVEKAKVFGLTKATKYLQINHPQSFYDLSPSTLQYWLQRAKSITN